MKPISTAERRRADVERRTVIQSSNLYARSLASLRYKELGRVLKVAKDYDPRNWDSVIMQELSEREYFPAWYRRAFISAATPAAEVTAKRLVGTKAESEFDQALMRYANSRAGKLITSVSQTYRDGLIAALRRQLEEDIATSVEKMAKVLRGWAKDELLWQARRIAQTEMLIGAAEGAATAANSLNIDFTVTWAVSGLGNTREQHLEMDGVTIEPGDVFLMPNGDRMRYPHDAEGGSAENIINCACSAIRRPKE